jgi:hypothetical protein
LGLFTSKKIIKKNLFRKFNLILKIFKIIGDRIENNGYYEFSVKDNWAVEQNRARRYRMGALAVTLLSGGTEQPK